MDKLKEVPERLQQRRSIEFYSKKTKQYWILTPIDLQKYDEIKENILIAKDLKHLSIPDESLAKMKTEPLKYYVQELDKFAKRANVAYTIAEDEKDQIYLMYKKDDINKISNAIITWHETWFKNQKNFKHMETFRQKIAKASKLADEYNKNRKKKTTTSNWNINIDDEKKDNYTSHFRKKANNILNEFDDFLK